MLEALQFLFFFLFFLHEQCRHCFTAAVSDWLVMATAKELIDAFNEEWLIKPLTFLILFLNQSLHTQMQTHTQSWPLQMLYILHENIHYKPWSTWRYVLCRVWRCPCYSTEHCQGQKERKRTLHINSNLSWHNNINYHILYWSLWGKLWLYNLLLLPRPKSVCMFACYLTKYLKN